MKLKELESLMQVQRVVCGYNACCYQCKRCPHVPATAPPRSHRRLALPPPPCHPQDIAPFANPKIELEQYPTGPHLASRLLYTVRGEGWRRRQCWLVPPEMMNAGHIFLLCRAEQAAQVQYSRTRLSCWPQVANSFDEFEGQTVIDLGCGTVRSCR